MKLSSLFKENKSNSFIVFTIKSTTFAPRKGNLSDRLSLTTLTKPKSEIQ